MKRIVFSILIIFVFVFSVYSQTGIIREFTGDVEIKPARASAFIPAQQGSIIEQDTIVSTGFRSTAVITVGSNTITVRPLTRLSLAEISSFAGTENLNVNLQTGRIRVEVKPPAGTRANTTVQSPSATASVRGTEFEMDTHNVEVITGSIGWEGSDGIAVSVNNGSSRTLTSEGGAQSTIEIITGSIMPSAPVGTGFAGETVVSSEIPTPSDGNIGVIVGW